MKKILTVLFILWALYPVSATFNVTQEDSFPVSVGDEIVGAVYLGDVNKDGFGEIVIETYNNIQLYDHTGSIIWSAGLNVGHKTLLKMPNPVAGNIAGDNKLEIVFGDKVSKTLYVWSSDKSTTTGFPRTLAGEIYSTPALADIDNDNYLEIAIGSDGNLAYLIDGDGGDMPGWPVNVGGAVHSKPAFGDIDGDNELEIVITALDDKVYAFNKDGSNVSGWPQSISDFGMAFEYNSPALGDIDNDGFDEVVVATTAPTLINNTYNGELIAFDGDGSVLWTYHTNYNAYSSPAIGNIDGDPYNEVIIGSLYKVYAVEHDGTEKWVASIGSSEVFSTPLLHDLTGDGINEVIVSAKNAYIYGWYGDGTLFLQEHAAGQIRGSPSIYEMDRDGSLELLVGTSDSSDAIYAWNIEYIPEGSVSPEGGSSGGGGGGFTGEDFDNIEIKESVSQYVINGKRIFFNFTKTDPILNVEFTALRNAGSVTAIIENLYNKSALVEKPAPYTVYKNANIYIGTYGYATEYNIKDATVSFRVKKDWIQSNEIDKSTVALHKYLDGSWVEQPTKLVSEDQSHVYYKAHVKSFSQFAITGRQSGDQTVMPKLEDNGDTLSDINLGPNLIANDNLNLDGKNKLNLFVVLFFMLLVVFLLFRYRKGTQ